MRLATPEEIKQGQTVYFCMIPGRTHEMKAKVIQDYEEGEEVLVRWDFGVEDDLCPLPLSHIYIKEEE